MQAILKEKDWLQSFLVRQPDNQYDKLLRSSIQNVLPRYIKKRKIETIARGLYPNIFMNLFRWIKIRRKYSFTLIDILLSILELIKINNNTYSYSSKHVH
jgi:hypothetical protein